MRFLRPPARPPERCPGPRSPLVPLYLFPHRHHPCSDVNSSAREACTGRPGENSCSLRQRVPFLHFKPRRLPPSDLSRLLPACLSVISLPRWSGTAARDHVPESGPPHLIDWGAGVRYAPQRSVALPVSQASRWQRPHGHFWAVAPHCSGRIKVIFPRHGLVLPGGESGCWAGGEPRARRHHIPRGPAPDGQQGCAPGPSLTRPLSSAWKAPRVLGPAGEEDEHNPPLCVSLLERSALLWVGTKV